MTHREDDGMRRFRIETPAGTVDLRAHLPEGVCDGDGRGAEVTLDELARLLQDLPASTRLVVTTGEWVPH